MNTYVPSDAASITFDKGWKAFESGKALVDNPHPEMSPSYEEWEDGYYAAQAARATKFGG